MIAKEEVTEGLLQKKLRGLRSNPRYIAENLYVYRWESDMLIKTRSGYWYEFECKISVADFKNDFTKYEKHDFLKTGKYWRYQCILRTQDETQMEFYNHECNYIHKDGKWWYVYAKRDWIMDAKGPNYFAYAVPWFIQDKVEPLIPEYAGLVVLKESGKMETVKKPPLLRNDKYTDEELNLCEKFYFNWRNRIEYIENNKQQEYINSLRGQIDFLKDEFKAVTGYDIKEVW